MGSQQHALIPGAPIPRQLFTPTTKLTRAKWPDGDDAAMIALAPVVNDPGWFYSPSTSYPLNAVLSSSTLPSWVNATFVGSEIVLPMGWSISRLQHVATQPSMGTTFLGLGSPTGWLEGAKSLDSAATALVPSATGGFGPVHLAPQKFYFENHAWLLNAPGEWLATSTDLYVVTDGGAPDVVVPRLETLLKIQGCTVAVTNVDLRNTTWTAPNEMGFIGSNADRFYRRDDGGTAAGPLDSQGAIPGAVQANGATVSFSGCAFERLGGVGLATTDSNVWVGDSTFRNISGAGVRIEGGFLRNTAGIVRNVFEDIGAEYAGQGVHLSGNGSFVVSQNRLVDVAAAGVYVYNGTFTSPPSASPDGGTARSIDHNTLIRNARRVTDTGGMHLGGDGLTIEANTVIGSAASGWNAGGGFVSGIYLDIGTTHSTLRDNLLNDNDVAFQFNCQVSNTSVGNDAGTYRLARSSVSYIACLFFHPYDGQLGLVPTFDPLLYAMADAGCPVTVLGDGGVKVSQDCPCNNTRTCRTNSTIP